MPNPARAALETALRARKLDSTLTGWGDPGAAARGDGFVAATGIPALDERLLGGLPRGQLSEIAGPRSSGRTRLLLQTMAAATARGEMAALVDTFDTLDVASASATGVALDRLLWIRGDAAVDRALKALNLVLQAGNIGVVALDLADASPAVLRTIPLTTWLRVQRTIEGSETACVIVGPEPVARSAGGVTLQLAGRPRWTGDSPRSRHLTGLDVSLRIVSPRRWVEGTVHLR